eukprot:scaffold1154_cov72-Phaeocystis_antarctica.AAC.1
MVRVRAKVGRERVDPDARGHTGHTGGHTAQPQPLGRSADRVGHSGLPIARSAGRLGDRAVSVSVSVSLRVHHINVAGRSFAPQ